MMRKIFLPVLLLVMNVIHAQENQFIYQPDNSNLKARKIFQDEKFGLFIHWGIFSFLGDGEWVMNNENIPVQQYKKLLSIYNPVAFDAVKWVKLAKSAGFKYITFVTRHHDGFSNWDTKASDWSIMHSPYHKDVFAMLARACHREHMPLFVYYSLLDWSREDYPRETGRTGKGSGRMGKSNYDHYFNFMKNQLTELLTHYGTIAGVWFDGHWDQTEPEGAKDRTAKINWRYNELYQLIHQLQPACLIGNNHHLAPFQGEDFQMFERDLPGENKSGLSFQSASNQLPLETCETINNSWGFNLKDDHYKTTSELIKLLVNAAGRNANLLLNIGPLPDGSIQQEFSDTLLKLGEWLKTNGQTIYGTRGNIIAPQSWGVITKKGKTNYVHILNPLEKELFVPLADVAIKKCIEYSSKRLIPFQKVKGGIIISIPDSNADRADEIIALIEN